MADFQSAASFLYERANILWEDAANYESSAASHRKLAAEYDEKAKRARERAADTPTNGDALAGDAKNMSGLQRESLRQRGLPLEIRRNLRTS